MEKEKANKIWNNFCLLLNKNKNSLEKEIQKIVETLFQELGWSFFDKEIISQKRIRIGSRGQVLIADIIIENNGKEIMVIELKQKSKPNTKRIEEQLFGNMHQSKIKFGIFIGENLQFYYEPPNNRVPIKVFETDFSQNNEEATEFISLISKPFEENKILNFCKKRILTGRDKERFEKLKKEIIDGIYDDKVKTLFIASLKKEYNEQIANNISNEIEVKISLEKPSVRKEISPSRKRGPLFTFNDVNIKPGTTLVFTEDERIECTVANSKNDRTVLYKNKEYFLAPLVQELRGDDRPVRGIRFFKIKGDKKTLEEKFDRMQ